MRAGDGACEYCLSSEILTLFNIGCSLAAFAGEAEKCNNAAYLVHRFKGSMMSTVAAVPVFEQNFDQFLHYLQDSETGTTSLSPKRYGQILRLDMQTLATQAHVHRNTISRAPDAESVQRYLRESVRVIRAAADVTGSVEKAIFWFKNNPLAPFDYKTPQELVSEGRAGALIRYIQSLQAGFAG